MGGGGGTLIYAIKICVASKGMVFVRFQAGIRYGFQGNNGSVCFNSR